MSRANSLLPTTIVGDTSVANITNTTNTNATNTGLYIPTTNTDNTLYPHIHQRTTVNPNLPPSQISNNVNTSNNNSNNSSNVHGLSLPIVRDLFGRD